MMSTHQRFDPRIFSASDLNKHLKIVIEHFSDLRKARKRGMVSKAFQEKIMLAVTQVNGCRICSYYHTKIALDSGINEKEIASLLQGELGEINQEEAVALMYAQHYAESDGKTDKETRQKFFNHYGNELAKDIQAYIMVIMIGNISGIAIDALQRRIRGKSLKGSLLWDELACGPGIVFLLPKAIIRSLFKN